MRKRKGRFARTLVVVASAAPSIVDGAAGLIRERKAAGGAACSRVPARHEPGTLCQSPPRGEKFATRGDIRHAGLKRG